MHLSADALSKILFPPRGIKERACNSMFYTKTSALLSRNCHTKKQTKKKRDCNTCLYPPPSLLQLQHGLYPAPTIIIIMMRYFNKQAALLFIFLHAFFLTNQGGLHPN